MPDEMEQSLERAAQKAMSSRQNTWQAFLSSYAPVSPSPPSCRRCAGIYLGQVNTLVEASALGARSPTHRQL